MNVINYRGLLSVGLKEYIECNQLQRVTKRGFEGVQ